MPLVTPKKPSKNPLSGAMQERGSFWNVSGWKNFLAMTCVAASLSVSTGAAQAELRTSGQGKALRLVDSQFSGEWDASYKLFSAKCTHCHSMARPAEALTKGITPVTGGAFEKDDIQKYVVKMMRKPKSGVSRDDAKEILKFLWYARDLAKN